MGKLTENEKFQKKMVTWNVINKHYEASVICNDMWAVRKGKFIIPYKKRIYG